MTCDIMGMYQQIGTSPFYLLSEQVFHCDDFLYPSCILVELQAVCRDESQMESVLAFGLFHESAELMAQVLVVAGVDGEIIFAEFHLADVADVVCSLND